MARTQIFILMVEYVFNILLLTRILRVFCINLQFLIYETFLNLSNFLKCSFLINCKIVLLLKKIKLRMPLPSPTEKEPRE